MAWISSALGFLQKERGWTGTGVPVEKAAKVDDKLRKSLLRLRAEFEGDEKTEMAELQAAQRIFAQRAAVVKGIERDVANLGESIAVQEKVANQLLALDRFFKTNSDLWSKDWAATKGHWLTFKNKRATSYDIAQVKKYLETQEKGLKDAQTQLQLLQNAVVGEIVGPKEAQKLAAQKTKYTAALEKTKKAITDLQNLQRTQKYESPIVEELGQYWKDLGKDFERVELPSISTIQDSPQIKQFRDLVEQELRALEMSVLYLDKQCQLLEACGVEVLPKAEEKNLSRGLSFLARATEAKRFSI